MIFTVTDATGLSIQAILTNTAGTDSRPTPPTIIPPPTLSLTLENVTLACGQSVQVTANINNPGTTAPTITTSISTPFTGSALMATTAGNVITLVRTSGDVGSAAPSPTTALVPAIVVVSAGSAGQRPIQIMTPYRCP